MALAIDVIDRRDPSNEMHIKTFVKSIIHYKNYFTRTQMYSSYGNKMRKSLTFQHNFCSRGNYAFIRPESYTAESTHSFCTKISVVHEQQHAALVL